MRDRSFLQSPWFRALDAGKCVQILWIYQKFPGELSTTTTLTTLLELVWKTNKTHTPAHPSQTKASLILSGHSSKQSIR